ncbi:MAG: sigma-70 family RNA polymerase sigma factor [Phycisphaerae bacterium]
MSREADLLERAVSGDDAALDLLLLGIHGRLRSSLAQRIPAKMQSVISVEDVLQDAYVLVFREIRRFEPQHEAAFYSWVAKIAENRLFDVIKAENAEKRGGGHVRVGQQPATTDAPAAWLEFLAVHERTPSRSAAGIEAARIIHDALSGLSPDYREALRLRYIEGLPVAQTAERMNRSEGAVCLLCHRGLKRLRESLGESARFFLSRA